MKLAKDMGVRSLIAKGDSQLAVSQVNGMYETKASCLAKYLEKSKRPFGKFWPFWVRKNLTIRKLLHWYISKVGKYEYFKWKSIDNPINYLAPSIERNESMFRDARES